MTNIIGLNSRTFEERTFKSIQEAQDMIGGRSTVKRCLDGKVKSTKGWLFRYEDSDFSKKAKTITDKRIKVYEMVKGDEKIQLPLEMLQNKVGVSKSVIIEASRGYKKNSNGARTKTKFAKGYSVREMSPEESKDVLNSISYIDYILSKKEAEKIERQQSMGEGIIATILDANNVTYEVEKPIPNTRMLMDFYIDTGERELCIEYQGVHHDRKRYKGGVDYQNKQKWDNNKKEYCLRNGIDIIYINHDFKLREIFDVLSKHLHLGVFPKEYKLYYGKIINVDKFLKFYLDNNREQTAIKYGIKQHDVKNILDKLEYDSKRVPKDVIEVYDKASGKYLGKGNYYSIQEDYGIHKSAISAIKYGKLKSSKGYILIFKEPK